MYDDISGVYVFESHISHMSFSVSRSDGSRSGSKLFGIGFLGLLNFAADLSLISFFDCLERDSCRLSSYCLFESLPHDDVRFELFSGAHWGVLSWSFGVPYLAG